MQCPYCRVAHIREDAEAKYCATCGLIEWKKEGDDMEEIIDLIARLVLEGKREEARTALHEYGSYRVRLDEQLNRKQWTDKGAPHKRSFQPEKVKQEVML